MYIPRLLWTPLIFFFIASQVSGGGCTYLYSKQMYCCTVVEFGQHRKRQWWVWFNWTAVKNRKAAMSACVTEVHYKLLRTLSMCYVYNIGSLLKPAVLLDSSIITVPWQIFLCRPLYCKSVEVRQVPYSSIVVLHPNTTLYKVPRTKAVLKTSPSHAH